MFVVVLAAVAALGAGAAKVGVAPLAMDKVALLTRILASSTAAGLPSTAFAADTLTVDTVGPTDLFQNQTARDSLGMVLLLLAAAPAAPAARGR